MLYKLDYEWQSESGYWYCGCMKNLAGNSNHWVLKARAMNLTPAQFIELLLTKYKPDNFYISEDRTFISFSWKNQSSMRIFKNDLNKAARKNGFQI